MTAYCLMTKTHQSLKPNTSTVWVTNEVEELEITKEHYKNITDISTRNFFRGLGGTEYIKRSNTIQQGRKITKLISTNPGKTERKIYTFYFF